MSLINVSGSSVNMFVSFSDFHGLSQRRSFDILINFFRENSSFLLYY